MSASQTILPIAIQAVPSRSRAPRKCPECHCDFVPYKRAQGYQVYCGQDCRVRAWKQSQDRRENGRETKAQRIVARLRQGPASTWDLAKVGGIRFGARLDELKAAGMTWDREDHADHSVYTMTREPRGCVPEGE